MAAIPVGQFTDASGTVTAGGTEQEALPANGGRQYLFIQNIDEDQPLWLDFNVAAVEDQPSIRLAPLAAIEYSEAGTGVVPTGYVSVIGETTGNKFVIKEA